MAYKLRPFFSYYGAKWKTALLYPEPRYRNIYEPFAGAAGYSLHYPSHDVRLYDTNPIIAGLWSFLIKVTEEEVRRLPLDVTDLREMKMPQEHKWLIGFWLNKGAVAPRNVPSVWMRKQLEQQSRSGLVSQPGHYKMGCWSKAVRGTIASQLKRIRHWKVYNRSYDEAPDREATWFVDPPYQSEAGRLYTESDLDYTKLGKWCKSRKGQVIACDVQGSDWLPFEPLAVTGVTNSKHKRRSFSKEVIYHRSDKKGRGLFKR